MPNKGITFAEELFQSINIRLRTPEERLYRLIETVIENSGLDAWLDRVTWDWLDDYSVEIYLDNNIDVDAVNIDLTRLWDAGFSLVWIHPVRCSKDGNRDWTNCKCPAKRRPAPPPKPPRGPHHHYCDECPKGAKRLATWVRCTQFAGDHFFCAEHAGAQPDFQRETDLDTTFFWISINDYVERKPKVK